MIFKADKIREYAIENGIDLTRITNSLVRQIAQTLTRTYGEEFKPNTVKLTLYKLRSRQPKHEEPEEPEPEEEPPPIAPTTTKHETPPPTQQPPPIRLGQFQIHENQNGTANIYCPTCGSIEFDYPLPTKIEKEVEQVEVIPKGYIRAPKGGEDWLRILSLKHEDGKAIWECPNCAKTLLAWFNKNKTRLEKAAGVKKEGDLLDTILDLGTAVYKAWQISQQLQARPS